MNPRREFEYVDRGLSVLGQDVAGQPCAPASSSDLVAVAGCLAVQRTLRQFERDDVERVGGEQPLALVRRHDIIRRRRQSGDVGPDRARVADCSERADDCHGAILSVV
jgi:hypothetical protein